MICRDLKIHSFRKFILFSVEWYRNIFVYKNISTLAIWCLFNSQISVMNERQKTDYLIDVYEHRKMKLSEWIQFINLLPGLFSLQYMDMTYLTLFKQAVILWFYFNMVKSFSVFQILYANIVYLYDEV